MSRRMLNPMRNAAADETSTINTCPQPSDITLMSDEQFDAMMDALNHPRALPVLGQVVCRPRIYRPAE